MFSYVKMPTPTLGLTGLEAELTEEELAIQDAAHRIAVEVMRPIGEKLDKMTPEEVIAPESPLWVFAEQIKASGILDLETMMGLSDEQKARIVPIIFEELGWGDPGLALFAMVTAFPAFAALATGDSGLIEQFGSRIGCWVATQPDRGSDLVDVDAEEIHPGSKQSKPNLVARIEGDEVVLSGQSSAWVSGAPVAQTALVYVSCDYGEGVYNDKGGHHQIVMLVSLEDPRVSKGKPLDKIGQRTLPQGELYFDDVSFTGVARAAYEHALAYVHERKQGGTELINHQSVRLRIFDLWQKLEASRALAHRVAQYNYSPNGPHLLASVTSKTFVTQNAFDIASESLQLFGGNGLSKEYPLEKILRDARAAMIEDGENNILNLKGANWLSKWYRKNH
jgi:alkylation response protein AidB-like acyl-CoA dehydrogenase